MQRTPQRQNHSVGNIQKKQCILEKEGPKYQYGKGCLIDGVLGAWIAQMCGLTDPLIPKK